MPPRLTTLRLLLVAVFAATPTAIGSGDGGRQDYVVYLGHLPSTDGSGSQGFSAVEVAHHDLLNQVLDDDGSSPSDRILRSYKRSLNGFAAKLTEQEAHKLSSMEGVVSIFPSRTLELLTTRSWDFLDFPQTTQEELPLQGEVIVGMLDTGVWPDSPSFSDEGFLQPPSRWKGTCQNITCNKKIIGARAYYRGSTVGRSPVDKEGHGSHTASIVAARAVGNVSYGGLAAGTARGAVPGARLAIYKVCWVGEGCKDVDILAGFDDAIADGVDVISFSVGGHNPQAYFLDTAAIGSFHAMRRGVVTSAAAGNSGLTGGHVYNPNNLNVAPWMLSVAASSSDRRFFDRIVLGNGGIIVGLSINTFPTLQNVELVIPNDSNPTGTIESTKTTVDAKAPVAASFSSPGPNLITPGILKPDLSAPGIDIIASWSMLSSPTENPNDNRKVLYNIISGTSMACPHASGAAAYLKSVHRNWSPAMIMSALVTTATPMDTPGNSGRSALKYGAGQLSPAKVRDPGLVYDASESDYIAMLCAQGYNGTQLALIIGSTATACAATAGSPSDLNYPTMAARVEPGKNFAVSFPRTVTNVGSAASAVYNAKVVLSTKDIAVAVSPSKLEFSALSQKASFTVTVSGVAPAQGKVHSAAVVWYNDEHHVRSPVVVYAVEEGV